MRKYFEINENNNTLCQSLCDTGKAMHRRKFIALNAHIEKEELKSISPSTSRKKNSKLYQTLYILFFLNFKKEQQTSPLSRRRQEL